MQIFLSRIAKLMVNWVGNNAAQFLSRLPEAAMST